MKLSALVVFCGLCLACTNLIVTKGASEEGYNVFGYNGDSALLYGSINVYPEADHPFERFLFFFDIN
jgi:hypothetical protein